MAVIESSLYVQELATDIGDVMINKCFCTRRNPINISAAAIYLACQLEDKRKTHAEICKVTGLRPSGKDEAETNENSSEIHAAVLNQLPHFRKPWLPFWATWLSAGDKNQPIIQGDVNEPQPSCPEFAQKGDMSKIDKKGASSSSLSSSQFSNPAPSNVSTSTWPFRSPPSSGPSLNLPIVHPPKLPPGYAELKGLRSQN
ncbi:hypothetical protein DITRI_Ditri16bG0022800 [Diplodiscus trichospermus]